MFEIICIFLAFSFFGIITIVGYYSQKRYAYAFSREKVLNILSSLLSDLNVDYRDTTISPQNIANIAISITHFGDEITKIEQYKNYMNIEDSKWILGIIHECDDALRIWRNRHVNELTGYETSLNLNHPSIYLAHTRLEMQKQNWINIKTQ